jgi:hypothetical protein
MADKLVTLGTFDSPVEARFAVNRLEEAGIPALVADKNTVAMDFLLGNAVGCIKVQVQAADLERAEAVLADPTDRVPEDETPWDDADQSGAADAGERADVKRTIADQRAAPAAADAPPDRGERLVTVAYRLPVFGAIFVPRNVVSLVYVLVVTFGVNDLSPAATRRFFLALLIDLGLLAFLAMLFCAGYGSDVLFI